MALPENLKGKLKLPVVAAPMFLVSYPKLVIESCNNGILGTMPALNLRTTEKFRQALHEIKAGVGDKPYGINLIVHHTNPRLEADLQVCIEEKVPVIITSLGAVSELVKKVQSYGGVVFHDVTILRHAKKAAGAGVDGLIAVSSGAGGHAGIINPFALVSEIRSFYDKTILLAGSLSSGYDVAAAIAMGADLAYMGTRFINTKESSANDEYKNMINESTALDIAHTPIVSGIPANFLKASLKANGFNLSKLDSLSLLDKIRLKYFSNEAKAWKTVWSAGHGVSAIHDVPTVAELVATLTNEFEAAKKRLS